MIILWLGKNINITKIQLHSTPQSKSRVQRSNSPSKKHLTRHPNKNHYVPKRTKHVHTKAFLQRDNQAPSKKKKTKFQKQKRSSQLKAAADANRAAIDTKDAPIHLAARQGHLHVVRMLLEVKADVEAIGRFACFAGFFGMMLFFLIGLVLLSNRVYLGLVFWGASWAYLLHAVVFWLKSSFILPVSA